MAEEDNFSDYDSEEDEDPNRIKLPPLSKFEEDMLLMAKQRQKDGIVKPQVVTGKVFKGQSFISKPKKIVFKDFEVGVPHTQTILMTNVSYSFNSFKLLPLKDEIRDFFDIKYQPAGRMSAGLTTTIKITFTPQLNQDIFSVFPILAEDGPIDIPLECTCKKTVISLSETVVDIGDVILGETGKRVLKFTNDGALTTKFNIRAPNGELLPAFGETLDAKTMATSNVAIELDKRASEMTQEVKTENEHIADEDLDPFTRFISQLKFHRTAEIGGYSSFSLPFTFIPTHVGDHQEDFMVIFDNEQFTPPIKITLIARCVDVPIYVEKLVYDFEICSYEHTYREKMILFNRSMHPMKIQMYYPKELKPYIEFNPTLGYIQGHNRFEIWSKFRPDRSILNACQKYIKGDELKIPLKVVGANQVVPVVFDIKVRLSVDSITFSPDNLDFGDVFLNAGSLLTVKIQNHSLLPQEFAFSNLPKEFVVAPNDGFGTLLPNETFLATVAIRPNPMTKSRGDLGIKMKTGKISARELRLPWSINIVKCPIKFSSCFLDMPSLPLEESVEQTISVVNTTGKPYNIELSPPEYQVSGIRITPMVAKLDPGQSTIVSIRYNSAFRDLEYNTLQKVNEQNLDKENKTLGLLKKMEEDEAAGAEDEDEEERKKKEETAAAATKGKGKGKDDKKKDAKPAKKTAEEKRREEEEEQRRLEEETRKEQERKELEERLQTEFDKDGQLAKLGGLVYDFNTATTSRSQHYEWSIPCFFKSLDKTDLDMKTSYLKVKTCTTFRTLEVDKSSIDFGEIAVSCKKSVEILLTNHGNYDAQLQMDPLTPFGGFSVLNALRTIAPGKSRPLVLVFEPMGQQVFEETLVLRSQQTTVSVTLRGRGIRPEINIEPEDGLLWMGDVLLGDRVEKSFNIKNISSFALYFNFVAEAVGTKNQNGLRGFTFIPDEGSIEPGQKLTVRVMFCPDHPSEDYFESFLIEVPNQWNPKRMYLKGACWDRQMYVKVDHPFVWPEKFPHEVDEALSFLSPDFSERKRIVLEFMKEADNIPEDKKHLCTKRSILIGNCKLNDPKSEKGGTFEITMGKDELNCFSCDVPKGNVNAGLENKVTFTFNHPPTDPIISEIEALQGIGQWVEVACEGKITGGFIFPGAPDVYFFDIVLRAYVQQI